MRLTTGFFTLAALILGGAYALRGGLQSSRPEEKSPLYSLCELTANWQKYDHMMVRIQAIYRGGNETSEVYDSNCANGGNSAWVPPDFEGALPPNIKNRLDEILRVHGRARIVVTGEFDGPKKVDIPSGTSPGLAKIMSTVDSRYGHMNHWKFQFVFSEIESTEAVPASDPWPHQPSEKKQ